MREIEITSNSNPMIIKSFLLDDDPEAIDSMSIIANLRQGKILGFKYRDENGEKEHRLTHREWIQLKFLLIQLDGSIKKVIETPICPCGEKININDEQQLISGMCQSCLDSI